MGLLCSSRAGLHLGRMLPASSCRVGPPPGRVALDTTSRAGLHLPRGAPSCSSRRGLHLGKVALGSLSRAALHLGKTVHLGSSRPGLHLGGEPRMHSSGRTGLGPGRMPLPSGSRAGWHPGGATPGGGRMQGPTLGGAGAAISLSTVVVGVVGGAAAGLDLHRVWRQATPVDFDISVRHGEAHLAPPGNGTAQ